ncbi:hypothetical protein KY290_021076 [Solanum tuberosum]|uniref:Uncharacterized protein n=1 Tax=Solanum tuberosum TaxID=4113 RepID=A0ABQ7V2I5_SOLTU|nr:hypothetical protein KY290_021076 [Solanum tuberosum]
MFLLQRSQANWIRLGDANTRYFYPVIKQRQLKQAIEQQLEILKLLNAKDVRKVVFSIDKKSRPSPDGYGSDFYKEAWDIVGKMFLKNYWISSGMISY